MRKTIIESVSTVPGTPPRGGLDVSTVALLEQAEVEITSEDAGFPVEDAFASTGNGWRAGKTGPQIIRLRFDPPVAIREVQIRFVERELARSQEFAIYAETAASGLREVVRQQFTFNPDGATEEVERFTPNLDRVTVLELRIDPDRNHNPADSRTYATLAALRLG